MLGKSRQTKNLVDHAVNVWHPDNILLMPETYHIY